MHLLNRLRQKFGRCLTPIKPPIIFESMAPKSNVYLGPTVQRMMLTPIHFPPSPKSQVNTEPPPLHSPAIVMIVDSSIHDSGEFDVVRDFECDSN